MIEEYVIKELNGLKEENQRLRDEVNKLKNIKVASVEDEPVYIDLKNKDYVIKTLEEKGYNLQDVSDNYGSQELSNLIKTLELYKDYLPSSKKDVKAIVRVDKKYYELTTYYSSEYRMENQVFISIDDAVYNDLTDKLYDMINDELRERKKTKDENK